MSPDRTGVDYSVEGRDVTSSEEYASRMVKIDVPGVESVRSVGAMWRAGAGVHSEVVTSARLRYDVVEPIGDCRADSRDDVTADAVCRITDRELAVPREGSVGEDESSASPAYSDSPVIGDIVRIYVVSNDRRARGYVVVNGEDVSRVSYVPDTSRRGSEVDEDDVSVVSTLRSGTPGRKDDSVVGRVGGGGEVSVYNSRVSKRDGAKSWAQEGAEAVGADYKNRSPSGVYLPTDETVSNSKSGVSCVSVAVGSEYAEASASNCESYTSYTVAAVSERSVDVPESSEDSGYNSSYSGDWYWCVNIGDDTPVSSTEEKPIYKSVSVCRGAMCKGNIRIGTAAEAIERYYSDTNGGILVARNTAAVVANTRVGTTLVMEDGSDSSKESSVSTGGEASVDSGSAPTSEEIRESSKTSGS